MQLRDPNKSIKKYRGKFLEVAWNAFSPTKCAKKKYFGTIRLWIPQGGKLTFDASRLATNFRSSVNLVALTLGSLVK